MHYDNCPNCKPLKKMIKEPGISLVHGCRFAMVFADHIILSPWPAMAERTGCQAIGNLCDIASKFVAAGPTTTTSSDDMYRMFTIKWIAYMGVPECIGSDMGSAFVANAAKCFEQLFGVKVHMFNEAPDHHEHVTYIENLNKLLRDMIDRAELRGDVRT